jgi:hypothetical protein
MVALCLLVSGCSWLRGPQFAKFVADVEVAQNKAHDALELAKVAFDESIKLVPKDAQEKARKTFDDAVKVLTELDKTTTDLRKAALATQETPADPTQVVMHIIDAVATVISAADVFAAPQDGDAGVYGAPSGFEEPASLAKARKIAASIEVPQ